MSDKYKIQDKDKAYLPAVNTGFVTLTIIGWIDVFTKKEQKLIIYG